MKYKKYHILQLESVRKIQQPVSERWRQRLFNAVKIFLYLQPFFSSQGLCRGREPARATGHQTGGPGTPHHVPTGGGGNLGIG